MTGWKRWIYVLYNTRIAVDYQIFHSSSLRFRFIDIFLLFVSDIKYIFDNFMVCVKKIMRPDKCGVKNCVNLAVWQLIILNDSFQTCIFYLCMCTLCRACLVSTKRKDVSLASDTWHWNVIIPSNIFTPFLVLAH